MADEKKGGALVAAAANLPAMDAKAAAAALKQSSDENSTGGDGSFEYLSFSGKAGKYSLGRDKVEPDLDAIYIVEPLAAVEGWACWKNRKPVEKHEWSLYERAAKQVRADDLKDHGPYNEKAGEGWSFMLGIGMFDVDNPDVQIKFTSNSVSGRNSISDLNSAVADELIDGNDGIAVISLGMEEFEAQGQVNWKPTITIEGFVSRAEVEVFLAEDEYDVDDLLEGRCVPATGDEEGDEPAEEEQEEAPKKRTRSKSKPKPEPKEEEPAEEEQAEEKPAKRRRRKAAE